MGKYEYFQAQGIPWHPGMAQDKEVITRVALQDNDPPH